MMTGRPRSSGRSRCSTAAKNASMSRWRMTRVGGEEDATGRLWPRALPREGQLARRRAATALSRQAAEQKNSSSPPRRAAIARFLGMNVSQMRSFTISSAWRVSDLVRAVADGAVDTEKRLPMPLRTRRTTSSSTRNSATRTIARKITGSPCPPAARRCASAGPEAAGRPGTGRQAPPRRLRPPSCGRAR